MVCFLPLLGRTITPNRTSTQRQVLRFQLCTHSLLKATRISAFVCSSSESNIS